MDKYLIDYLRSGEAWVLVGSGPSNACGYPTWYDLAKIAVKYYESKNPVDKNLRGLLESEPPDYPAIFQSVSEKFTLPDLVRELKTSIEPLRPSNTEIYDTIASWPVPVYLTTNFDDQLQKSLVSLKEAYIPYSNSLDHMAQLHDRSNGIIVKLHGDLRSTNGLILTTDQYKQITEGAEFEYWRSRMNAFLQMRQIVIIGHSLSDPNIQHVLEIAKLASNVERPICWIADDSNLNQSIDYLKKFRIKIIGYPNKTGNHEGPLPLLKKISRFVPPRESLVLTDRQIQNSKPSRTASALYVFNRLGECSGDAIDRINLIIAAIMGEYDNLKAIEPFTISDVLKALRWPESVCQSEGLINDLEKNLLTEGIFTKVSDRLTTTAKGTSLVQNQKNEYQQLLDRFIASLNLRIKSSPLKESIDKNDIQELPNAIERSLSKYFEESGLSFSSIILNASKSNSVLPINILDHIKEESMRFHDLRARQLFMCVTLDMFCEPRSSEKEFIGRISEGFFAYHSMGVFGEVWVERRRQLNQSVWLLDSNMLIHLIAEGYTPGLGARRTVEWLNEQKIRLFTLNSLFEELFNHFEFAVRIINQYGENSYEVMAAATGESPFYRPNAFLQGFLELKGNGKCGSWQNYCIMTVGSTMDYTKKLMNRLCVLGVEVIHFSEWPGFNNEHEYGIMREYENRIIDKSNVSQDDLDSFTYYKDPYKKAKPEAEAMAIIDGERAGCLNIFQPATGVCNAWFISDTTFLNTLTTNRITWQTVCFEMYISSLMGCKAAEDVSFSSIVECIAQSGYSVVNKNVLEKAFSCLIDESTISIKQERNILDENLGKKYSESVEDVLERIPPARRPIAAIQLHIEALNTERKRREAEEESSKEKDKAIDGYKKTLEKVSKLALKNIEKREQKAKSRKRKQKSSKKKNKRKK